jgi:hypothetical protein
MHSVVVSYTILFTITKTDWGRGILKRLTVAQLVKKFLALYKYKGSLPHLQELAILSHMYPVYKLPSYLNSILALSTHLHLYPPDGIFP